MAFRLIGLRVLLRQFPSLRAVLLLALVMILATVISATALLLDLRQKELTHVRGEIVSLTRILSEQTTRTFEGVALTLQGARERLSDDFGRRLRLDSAPVYLLLHSRSAGLPQVKSIFVIDSHGRGVNSSRRDFIRGLDMTGRSFFRHFVENEDDEIFISPPEKARVDGQWAYYASIRLLDAAGEFRGVLVASISIDYFESLYASIGLDFISRIVLLDSEGTLLAGKPHDEAMFGKISASPANLVEVRALREGEIREFAEQMANGKRYVAYRRVAKYPLLVGASVEEDEALTPWRSVVRPIVAGVSVMLLFVLVATFMVLRNLLRKAALEAALQESDEKLRHMVQSVQDAIVTVNSAKRVVLFNDAAERMFGIRSDEAIDGEIDTLLARCMRSTQVIVFQRYLEDGRRSPACTAPLGVIELLRDEREFPVELSLSTITFHGEQLSTLVFRDLSESQRVQLELLETNRQLKDLSASLQNVREEARARIARELHDELGQLLTGIRMEVSWLGGRLRPEQQLLIDKVHSVKGQIDQTIASVRRISSELRPLVLDDLGFAAAAAWYVDQFSARTGLPVELILPADDPERGDAVATTLFRILQESLTNVARHAGASKVAVRLGIEDDNWALSIRDDGVGFVHDPVKDGDMGLVGMRERAQILGGHFSLTTSPGKGTLIEVLIPAEKMRARQ